MKRLSLALRLLLAVLIGLAAFTKLGSMEELFATLGRSGLLLPGWERPVAYGLLSFEFLLAALLLLPPLRIQGLWGMAGLTSIFFGYSVWRWWEDIRAPCGCFGVLFQLEPIHAGAMATLMCACAMACLRMEKELRLHVASFARKGRPLGGNIS